MKDAPLRDAIVLVVVVGENGWADGRLVSSQKHTCVPDLTTALPVQPEYSTHSVAYHGVSVPRVWCPPWGAQTDWCRI